MDFSKAAIVVLYYILLFNSGVSGLCNINFTTLTADCTDQNLHNVPSYIPYSIEVLDLSDKLFQQVNPNQFRCFQNLEKLYLAINNISHLGNNSGSGLSTLRVLDISSNDLQDLNSDFFASFPNLQTLSIGYNYLEVFIFEGLKNLTTLDMRSNRLLSVNSTPFMELEFLEDLDLSSCSLGCVTDTMFTGLLNLLKLYLKSNGLKYLHSGAFASLTKLKVLDLSYNHLMYSISLPTDIFEPLIHLEELNLYMVFKFYKHIHGNYTYMDDVISKLPSLKRLNISAAPNAKFGPGYTALKNLEYLHIDGNLSEINNETFAYLKYTRSLNLGLIECDLSIIHRNALNPLQNITSLDVSSTDSLCSRHMRQNFTAAICNSRLKVLIARDICQPGVEPKVWRYCDKMKLEFLDMSYSNVYEIEYFPVSLKYLHLTNNNIHPGYFSLGHLDRMHNLKKLDLSDQSLEVADSITPLKKELIQKN